LKRGNAAAIAPEIRDYGIGAQILDDLGVKRIIRLSNNPRPLIGLEGYGLQVLETRPIAAEKTP
jgi:3,4-dihydroxy 2-butanone 4-phosphate synthase/GTP cyclohydrolase II